MGGRAVVADRCLGSWEGVSPRPGALPFSQLVAADIAANKGTIVSSEKRQQLTSILVSSIVQLMRHHSICVKKPQLL